MKRFVFILALGAMVALSAYAGPAVGQTDGNSITLPVYHDTTGRAVSSLTTAELNFLVTVPQADGLRGSVQEMILGNVVHVPADGKYHIGDAVRYWGIYQSWTGPAKVTVPLIPGPPGTPGTSGTDGQNGIGVVSAFVDDRGHLIVNLSNGSRMDTGYVIGPQGAIGATGATGGRGPRGFPGQDGRDGVTSVVYLWSYAGQQQPLYGMAAAPSNYGYFSVAGSSGFGGWSYNGGTNITATGGAGGHGGQSDVDIENNNTNTNANANTNNNVINVGDGSASGDASSSAKGTGTSQ